MSGPVTFLRNLVSGDFGVVERSRRVAGNIVRRNLVRGRSCCGHYGDPGC